MEARNAIPRVDLDLDFDGTAPTYRTDAYGRGEVWDPDR
jgi:hypothetical protein